MGRAIFGDYMEQIHSILFEYSVRVTPALNIKDHYYITLIDSKTQGERELFNKVVPDRFKFSKHFKNCHWLIKL